MACPCCGSVKWRCYDCCCPDGKQAAGSYTFDIADFRKLAGDFVMPEFKSLSVEGSYTLNLTHSGLPAEFNGFVFQGSQLPDSCVRYLFYEADQSGNKKALWLHRRRLSGEVFIGWAFTGELASGGFYSFGGGPTFFAAVSFFPEQNPCGGDDGASSNTVPVGSNNFPGGGGNALIGFDITVTRNA